MITHALHAMTGPKLENDNLILSVIHDLQQPLTIISGYAQIIQRDVDRGKTDPQQFRDNIDRIAVAASRMRSMLEGEVSRSLRVAINAPPAVLLAHINLVTMVQQAIDEQRFLSPNRDFRFSTSNPEIKARVDELHLQRVVANLLSNAVKYSSPDSTIWIRVELSFEDHGSITAISVTDKGMGIPAHEMHRIFNRFYRASNAVSEVPGSGLGLWGARQIVERYHGTLDAESTEGYGSTFTLRLPLTCPN